VGTTASACDAVNGDICEQSGGKAEAKEDKRERKMDKE